MFEEREWNGSGLFLSRKKRRNRVNRECLELEVENFSRGSITVTCINGGKRFVLSSGVTITDTVCDFFHVGSVAASEFFKNSKHFFLNP